MAELVTTSIVNISELRIGDKVCKKGHHTPLFVVGLLADPGELVPSDHTGTIYCDFYGSTGDVLEFNVDEIEKIVE